MKKILEIITSSLLTIIGVDRKSLCSCLPVTQSLYGSLSMVFMAVIIYATVMMMLTMSTITDSISVIILSSFVYFLFVAGLERTIINKSFGIPGFVMRILLAALIATAVSIPAEMWVFRKEIDFEIAKNESNRVKSNIQDLETYKNSTGNKISDYRNTINEKNLELEKLIKEETTEKVKSTVAYRVRHADGSFSMAYRFVPTARLKQIQMQIPNERKLLTDIVIEYDNERNYFMKSNNDYTSFIEKNIKSNISPVTFASRYEIMRNLQEKNRYLNEIGWGIMLFFFCIEIMVLLLKTIIRENDYEELQKYYSLQRIARLKQKCYELNMQMHNTEVKSLIRTDIKNLIRPIVNSFKKNEKNNHYNNFQEA